MLPYILDPHGPGTRRDVLRDEALVSSRTERKRLGAFYTPSDVADHIVELALDRLEEGRTEGNAAPTILDPACGTGVFLRSAVRELVKRRGLDIPQAVRLVTGVDIDPRAIEGCAAVLALEMLVGDSGMEPSHAWAVARSRLHVADALLLVPASRPTLDSSEQDLVDWRADVVVGNPPYCPLTPSDGRLDLAGRFETLARTAGRGADAYIAFVEMMWKLVRSGGAAAMVVPLSVAYSSRPAIRVLREAMTRAGGSWSFEFFDRTPDALFGDDVKQRTAILVRGDTGILSAETGPFRRWTSADRHALFASPARVRLADATDLVNGIPKLASAIEAETWSLLRATAGAGVDIAAVHRVRPVEAAVDHDKSAVFVAGTAYNWLSAYREGPASVVLGKRPSTSPLHRIGLPTPDCADAMYAVLCSRLVLWWWRATGDGFHVTSSFLTEQPIRLASFTEDAREHLASLGRELWRAVREHPVTSLNGGASTITYCPHRHPALLKEIDALLVRTLGLPREMMEILSRFAHDLTIAGRVAVTAGRARALAAWGTQESA